MSAVFLNSMVDEGSLIFFRERKTRHSKFLYSCWFYSRRWLPSRWSDFQACGGSRYASFCYHSLSVLCWSHHFHIDYSVSDVSIHGSHKLRGCWLLQAWLTQQHVWCRLLWGAYVMKKNLENMPVGSIWMVKFLLPWSRTLVKILVRLCLCWISSPNV